MTVIPSCRPAALGRDRGHGAAATLHAETGAAEYEHWYRTLWDFAELHLLDREHGSWHAELDETLQPGQRTWTGKPDG